ncbi:MAG: ATPase, T2SS/T4P/T4SS family [bacterium]
MLVQVKPSDEIRKLLRPMVSSEAQEMLMLAGEPPALRIHGTLVRQGEEPLDPAELTSMAAQLFGEEAVAGLGGSTGLLRGIANIDGSAYGRAGENLRIMFTASRSGGEVSLAARMAAYRIVGPDQIGLPQAVLDAADAPSGLLIFTGPTGSGKTSAAAAVLEHLNATKPLHICLMDDPMQFQLQPKLSIVQHKDLHIDMPDFVSGMRAAMAQDIDVIYLAEIRTLEELRMCLTIAQTGHLVITVLHANTALDAVERIRRAFPDEDNGAGRRDLADALRCVTALRLLRRSSGQGRVAAYEVLIPDEEMREAIASGNALQDHASKLPQGSQSFADSLSALLESGAVTQAEVDRVQRELGS